VQFAKTDLVIRKKSNHFNKIRTLYLSTPEQAPGCLICFSGFPIKPSGKVFSFLPYPQILDERP
jgi:hypothetical protein